MNFEDKLDRFVENMTYQNLIAISQHKKVKKEPNSSVKNVCLHCNKPLRKFTKTIDFQNRKFHLKCHEINKS